MLLATAGNEVLFLVLAGRLALRMEAGGGWHHGGGECACYPTLRRCWARIPDFRPEPAAFEGNGYRGIDPEDWELIYVWPIMR